ncbi:hypothetical protein [Lysinibacillus sphaericus]|nr:hypothetical protein [Lysinibacillus sphaericus]
MNTLEQTTNELLEKGYTIEEIKAAFEEVINKAKQSKTIDEADN